MGGGGWGLWFVDKRADARGVHFQRGGDVDESLALLAGDHAVSPCLDDQLAGEFLVDRSWDRRQSGVRRREPERHCRRLIDETNVVVYTW